MTSIITAPLHNSSRRTPRDRLKEEFSDGGRLRSTMTLRFAAYEFDLVWMWRSKVECDQVEAFWRSARDNKFSYVWPPNGVTYLARFIAPPQVNLHAPDYWQITVKLIGRQAA